MICMFRIHIAVSVQSNWLDLFFLKKGILHCYSKFPKQMKNKSSATNEFQLLRGPGNKFYEFSTFYRFFGWKLSMLHHTSRFLCTVRPSNKCFTLIRWQSICSLYRTKRVIKLIGICKEINSYAVMSSYRDELNISDWFYLSGIW